MNVGISEEEKERMTPFKIEYRLNIMPSMSESDGQIIEALSKSDELPMF
jgi:hypothetical protein